MRIFRSSEMQRRLVVTVVSGQHVGLIFKSKTVQEEVENIYVRSYRNGVGSDWFFENVTLVEWLKAVHYPQRSLHTWVPKCFRHSCTTSPLKMG